MRKKAGIVIAAGICGVLCGILAGWLFWGGREQKTDMAGAGQEGIKMSTGTYIAAANDTHIVVFDNSSSPVVMHNKTGDEGLFPDLKTGDRILAVHDNEVMETYPEQMNVYMYCRIGEGGSNTFVEEALKALKDLGWDVEEIE